MKLIYVIVRDIDSSQVIGSLNKQGFYVTKMSSTGGFLRQGNTTLMIVTEENLIDKVIDIVKKECGSRQQIDSNHAGVVSDLAQVVVNVGGATIFVTNVERFEQI